MNYGSRSLVCGFAENTSTDALSSRRLGSVQKLVVPSAAAAQRATSSRQYATWLCHCGFLGTLPDL
jgi:hypothetical protein